MRFASAIALLSLTLPAGAQEQITTITLSCNGTNKLTATTAADQKPDPIKDLGIIVNLADHTVTFSEYVVPITSITATEVSFSGKQTTRVVVPGVKPKPFTVSGTIDRVTGYASINWSYRFGNNNDWELTCRPTKRLF
jgi:hypothetical protein